MSRQTQVPCTDEVLPPTELHTKRHRPEFDTSWAPGYLSSSDREGWMTQDFREGAESYTLPMRMVPDTS